MPHPQRERRCQDWAFIWWRQVYSSLLGRRCYLKGPGWGGEGSQADSGEVRVRVPYGTPGGAKTAQDDAKIGASGFSSI